MGMSYLSSFPTSHLFYVNNRALAIQMQTRSFLWFPQVSGTTGWLGICIKRSRCFIVQALLWIFSFPTVFHELSQLLTSSWLRSIMQMNDGSMLRRSFTNTANTCVSKNWMTHSKLYDSISKKVRIQIVTRLAWYLSSADCSQPAFWKEKVHSGRQTWTWQ